MLRIMTLLTIALTAADHWTTYMCLRKPVEGWTVTEANPVAKFLFESAGLGAGLAIDTGVTLLALAFLVTTHLFNRMSKIGLLTIIALTTGYAVANNFAAMASMGLVPWMEAA